MKRALLSIVAVLMLAGTLVPQAEAQHHRHCWYSHHHRHCR